MIDDNNKAKAYDELRWGNITTNVRWNYILNNKLFANTTLSYSDYRFILSAKNYITEYDGESKKVSSNSFKFLNGIYDLSAKIDFDYFPYQNHIVKFGAGYCNHTFIPSSFSQNKDPGRDSTNRVSISGNEAFMYLEDNITLNKHANVNVGLHYSFFRTERKNYFHLQPRISATYSFLPNLAIKASYAKMVQYLQSNSYSTISLPIDLWVPSTDSLQPIESYNYALGIDYQYARKYNFGIEGFYKTLEHVKAFKEGAAPSPDFLGNIVEGKGWAYGVEFMINKNIGKTTGWLAYTWSHSWRQFDGISLNKKFPYKYDRIHNISLVAMHKFNDRIDITGTWVFSTGTAVSLSTEKYISNFALEAAGDREINKSHIQEYEQRNNYRMPNYHRLDIGVNFHKEKKRITRTWSFGAYNVYNRKNPLWIYWDDSEQFANKNALYQISLYQIIPYFSYSFKF